MNTKLCNMGGKSPPNGRAGEETGEPSDDLRQICKKALLRQPVTGRKQVIP